MTTTNQSDGVGSVAAEPSQLLKTDVLVCTSICWAQREAVFDILLDLGHAQNMKA